MSWCLRFFNVMWIKLAFFCKSVVAGATTNRFVDQPNRTTTESVFTNRVVDRSFTHVRRDSQLRWEDPLTDEGSVSLIMVDGFILPCFAWVNTTQHDRHANMKTQQPIYCPSLFLIVIITTATVPSTGLARLKLSLHIVLVLRIILPYSVLLEMYVHFGLGLPELCI